MAKARNQRSKTELIAEIRILKNRIKKNKETLNMEREEHKKEIERLHQRIRHPQEFINDSMF